MKLFSKFDFNILEINVLVLAYIGDGIYENYVRHFLIENNFSNVDDMQKESIKYVSAKSQAKYLQLLLDSDFFTEEEISVIKRARNYKSKRHPKNCDIITYKHATALEAVIGYLDLLNQEERIKCIMNTILGGKIC